MAKQLRNRSVAVAASFGFAPDEAEDVAQDAMLKLWCLHSSLTDSSHAEALNMSITRHLCVDTMRRQRTVPMDSRPVIDDRHATPDNALETADNERWLEIRLSQLPSNEHAVLHLRQVERKSEAEIAAILGISAASVPTLLSRARRKLLADIMRRQQR